MIILVPIRISGLVCSVLIIGVGQGAVISPTFFINVVICGPGLVSSVLISGVGQGTVITPMLFINVVVIVQVIGVVEGSISGPLLLILSVKGVIEISRFYVGLI